MSIIKVLIPVSILLGLSACATTMYTWENYDKKLYKHYRNPAEYEQFVEDLKEIIVKGEESGKVPPGLYAEYGYALYESGKYSEAMEYFQKEHDKWPESRIFMSKMINNAKKQEKRSSAAQNTDQ
jgi:hypothetical protein